MRKLLFTISIGFVSTLTYASHLTVRDASTLSRGTLPNARLDPSSVTMQGAISVDGLSPIILSSHIVDGTIIGNDIGIEVLRSSHILGGTFMPNSGNIILSSHIVDSAIIGNDIGSRVIQSTHIAPATITNIEIASSTIQGGKIAASTITGSNIADGSLEGVDIAAGTIASSHTVSGSLIYNSEGVVFSSHIANGSIIGNRIAAGVIQSTNTAAGVFLLNGLDVVRSSHILDGSLGGIDIAAGTISSSHTTAGSLLYNALGVIQATHTAGGIFLLNGSEVIFSTNVKANVFIPNSQSVIRSSHVFSGSSYTVSGFTILNGSFTYTGSSITIITSTLTIGGVTRALPTANCGLNQVLKDNGFGVFFCADDAGASVASDSLGSHVATRTLNMNDFAITGATQIAVGQFTRLQLDEQLVPLAIGSIVYSSTTKSLWISTGTTKGSWRQVQNTVLTGVVPTTGAVANFEFEEGIGTVIQDSINSEMRGKVFPLSDTTLATFTWVNGVVTGSYALNFPGSTGYMRVLDDGALYSPAAAAGASGAMTITAWVYSTNNTTGGGNDVIASKSSDPTYEWILSRIVGGGSDNLLQIELLTSAGGGVLVCNSTTAFTLNDWTFVAARVDKSLSTVYDRCGCFVNGSTWTVSTTDTPNQTTSDTNTNLIFGSRNDGETNRWVGRIDKFRIFPYRLSDQQLRTLNAER